MSEAAKERITITMSPGFANMLREEFPHQTLSATIQLLCEMAIDAELVMSRTKLTAYAAQKQESEESFGP